MARVLGAGEIVAGRYRVLGVVGRGGVGTTYAAEQTESGQQVALKQLWLWHGQDWKVLDLFEREARVLSQLSHPSIPRYVDHFQSEEPDGAVFYLAQEMAPGRSLEAWLKAGWRPSEEEVRVIALTLLSICEYLQAFQPSIIHRDIKPANVLRDELGRLFLVDFGAVRDTYRSTAQGSTVVGTFGYMAPEQLYGRALPTTDVYGVAATCAALLTGLSPEQLPRRRDRPNVAARVHVSRGFSDWLFRALAPAPEKRFASARAARLQLERSHSAALRGAARAIGLGLLLALLLVPPVALLANYYRAPATAKPGQQTAATRYADRATPERGRLKRARELVGHYTGVMDAVYVPGGKQLLTSAGDGTAKLWDLASGKPTTTFIAPERRVYTVDVTPDGKLVMTATLGEVSIFDRATGKKLRAIAAKGGPFYRAVFSPDGTKIAAGRGTGGVLIFSAEGEELAVLEQPSSVVGVAYSPDGRTLASGGHDNKLRLWNLETKQSVVLEGHKAPISDVVFSPDGKLLASVSDDRTLRVWYLTPPSLWRTYEGFADEVWSVAFSPDGKLVAGGAKDGSLGIWNVFTGERVDGLKPTGQPCVGVTFSPDGSQLVTGSAEVAIWTLRDPIWRPPDVTTPVVRTARTIPPDTPDEQKLCLQAEELLDQAEGGKKLDEAAALLDKALALNPKHAPAYVRLSRLEQQRGYKKESEWEPEALRRAHAQADRALELDPNLPEAHVRKGYVYFNQKDLRRARDSAEAGRRIDARHPGVLALLADLARRESHPEEALLHLRSLYETTSDPYHQRQVYRDLPKVYEKLAEWEAADLTYRSLLNLEPDSAWARVNFAAYLIRREEYDRGAEMAKAALAIRDFGMGRYQLSRASSLKAIRILQRNGDRKEAERLLDECAKAFPRSAEEQYGRGLVALARGDRDQARTRFERALKIEPDYPAVKEHLARLDRP